MHSSRRHTWILRCGKGWSRLTVRSPTVILLHWPLASLLRSLRKDVGNGELDLLLTGGKLCAQIEESIGALFESAFAGQDSDRRCPLVERVSSRRSSLDQIASTRLPKRECTKRAACGVKDASTRRPIDAARFMRSGPRSNPAKTATTLDCGTARTISIGGGGVEMMVRIDCVGCYLLSAKRKLERIAG